ncbi:MAG: TRAP transporter substrate-binding protein [Desulfatiglandaceae bacterium]
MIRKVFFLATVAIALSMIVAGAGYAKTFNFSLAHFWPGGHVLETQLVADWAKAINEATDGRVTITSYPGGTLISGGETYEGVVQGVADFGISAYAYTRGRFPVVESFLLPGIGYNTSKAASAALMEGLEKLDPQEIKDTKHIFSFSTGPGHLMMTGKRVTSMADMRGLTIGATAGPRADAVSNLGATPVIMPMPEWYEALSRGIMQGGIAPLEVLEGFRLGEVTADSITMTPFLYSQHFFLVMNLGKWNALPPDLQQIIETVSADQFENNVKGLWDGINARGVAWTEEKKAVEIIRLPPDEEALWIKAVEPIMDEHKKFLESRGLDGDLILKTVKELADKHNALYE